MKIYNVTLLTNNNNIGDKLASPLDYFKFPVDAEKIDIRTGNLESIRGSFIIFGGGGLIHSPSDQGSMRYLEDLCGLSPWLVSWGVGHNIHHGTSIKYPESFVTKFKLHGVRDMRQSLTWVPCASCMNELFHHEYESKHDVVATGHNLSGFDMPTLEHTSGASPEETIRFIASGDTVLTNSYHGAYWGALLNRKVIVFDPMSTKFYALPETIALASLQTWRQAVPTNDEGFLSLCRETNREHHKTVLGLLEDYQNEK